MVEKNARRSTKTPARCRVAYIITITFVGHKYIPNRKLCPSKQSPLTSSLSCQPHKGSTPYSPSLTKVAQRQQSLSHAMKTLQWKKRLPSTSNMCLLTLAYEGSEEEAMQLFPDETGSEHRIKPDNNNDDGEHKSDEDGSRTHTISVPALGPLNARPKERRRTLPSSGSMMHCHHCRCNTRGPRCDGRGEVGTGGKGGCGCCTLTSC
jgi:hypothetical protein